MYLATSKNQIVLTSEQSQKLSNIRQSSTMEELIFEPSPLSNHKRYMDDLNDSQGFYISPDTDGSQVPAGVRRFPGTYNGDHLHRAESAAKFAVEEHNKKAGATGQLKFVKILNLNLQPTAGVLYYITMAAADISGEARHYQVKVWETLNGRYQVKIFILAPYWLKPSDKLAKNSFCVAIDKLLPWMDEGYLYYKCFNRALREVLGVEVIRKEELGICRGLVWFRSSEEATKIVDMICAGKHMPYTNNPYILTSSV